jgi:glycosyltransferase involved in cell wall biosynthesis
MSNNPTPFAQLSDQSLFLVWGPPSHGPRSQVLARELGIKELHFVYRSTKRGLLHAPFKYSVQAIDTLRLLFRKRPKIVFVQSPPGLAVWVVYFYSAVSNNQYIVDAHSSAFLLPYWTYPRWIYRHLARKAVTTIVTNEHFEKIVTGWGGHAFILRDIPTSFQKVQPSSINGSFKVVVVNTYSPDEPLEQILDAAARLENVRFYVTGKKNGADPRLFDRAPGNVQFTDFLANDQYYGLLNSCDAVMCLTTQNHTMQRGACEALSLGKPIITSDWPLLREYFHNGTVHVQNNSMDIYNGVLTIKENYADYLAGIKELQVDQQREWERKVSRLSEILEKAVRS